MCHYCGCRQIPLIRDYIAEHARATEAGDSCLRAVTRGDLTEARRQLDLMAAELQSHWDGEEKGIFTVMSARDEMYADYVAPLVVEHRELAALLARIDLASPDDVAELWTAVHELAEHISKEEDGIFPVTLTELSGPEWDRAIAAWQAAHPGQELIAD
mgnify:CR=1 FL=1